MKEYLLEGMDNLIERQITELRRRGTDPILEQDIAWSMNVRRAIEISNIPD